MPAIQESQNYWFSCFLSFLGFWFLSGKVKCWRRVSELLFFFVFLFFLVFFLVFGSSVGKRSAGEESQNYLFFFEISQVAQAGKSTQRAETVINGEEIRANPW